jgi:hypothetical protein
MMDGSLEADITVNTQHITCWFCGKFICTVWSADSNSKRINIRWFKWWSMHRVNKLLCFPKLWKELKAARIVLVGKARISLIVHSPLVM